MGRSSDGRERMLTTASELFRERGIAGTALMDIIDRSGAARGSIYHYFPGGKAQLAREATERAGREFGAMITGLVAADGPVVAMGICVDYFRQRLVDSGYEAGCPITAAALEPGEAVEARRAAGESYAAWEAALANALWQHGVPQSRAAAVATLAISAIEGALILARAQRDSGPLDRVRCELERFGEALLRQPT
ncbi:MULTISPECIES: TetR/AcrR family transcriptional regulator [unclassified Nocardia]|uniref:TetR/AcrR family transcriptional regulator n=1 Tax=unclassified Nocardia TaxID=2637762 RepID=UPI001CE48DB3|nr:MULTISPECIES: TetR/AcrR family transcriptional regulator [unclassified Nocardia]